MNKAAPVRRISVKAICAVTIALRTRKPRKAVPARSPSVISAPRPACRAGVSPVKSPAAMLTRVANSNMRPSMAACNASAAVLRGRKEISALMASGANITPSNPPARAIRRLSATSCRPIRPRDAPRANLVLISRSRADPRARKSPATFRQAKPSSNAVAANNTQSGCESLRRRGA